MWYYIFGAIVALIFILFVSIIPNHESKKEAVEKIYEKNYRENLEYERRWNQLVDHYMQYTCDLVPYDDPDYNVKVREMAEGLAHTEMELDNEMELQDELHNGETQEETKELPW